MEQSHGLARPAEIELDSSASAGGTLVTPIGF